MKKTQKQLEKAVKEFNESTPIGTACTRYRLINPLSEGKPTFTASEAWIMGGHSAMVKVDGVSGGVCLESVITA
tara:strand:+ start:110 stop:331 length:222 start_codon:yes stop_codon:yes gene_type:complete